MQSVTRTKSRKERVNKVVMIVEKNKHITATTVYVIFQVTFHWDMSDSQITYYYYIDNIEKGNEEVKLTSDVHNQPPIN